MIATAFVPSLRSFVGKPEGSFMSAADRLAIVSLLHSIMPQRMVEIGINTGVTAKFVLDNVPSIKQYLGVDVAQGYEPELEVQRREIPARPGALALGDPRLTLAVSPRGSLDMLPSEVGECDAMLIDGDHGTVAVTHDTALARACVRKGGLILWHDYWERSECAVKPIVESMVSAGHRIFHVKGTWLAYEKVV